MKSKNLFLVLVFLLPLNLGKHFEGVYSYVWGLLIDYLVPVVYIQDILVLLILLLWLLEKGLPKKETVLSLFNKREFQVLAVFLFTLFLSVLTSSIIVPSVAFFLRVLLYSGLFLYITKEINLERDFMDILFILGLATFFVSVLGIAQYIKQASIFNNYLFFVEQPYSFSTWGISRENVLGYTVIPAYGLFKHPNVFGGFLSIVLVMMISKVREYKVFLPFIVTSLVALFFTFSYISLLCLLIGLVFLLLKDKPYLKKLNLLIVYFLLIFSMLLPFFKINVTHPSVYRRARLMSASYEIINNNFFFGIGLNTFTSVVDTYMDYSGDIRFTQPVHNIFALIFAEAGFFSFVLFIFLILLGFKNAKSEKILGIVLLQIVFLGCFDHYFITAHQMLLLFWITLGLIFVPGHIDKKI